MQERLVSDFYKNDAPAFGSADNIRKIASYIDGFKLSARKLIYTIFEKFPNSKIKTAQFANFCAAFTNYNQGESNLGGVASGLAQDFCGSNNYPPLKGSGNFGNRLDPLPAATRYTYVSQGDFLRSVFEETDRNLVPNQIYEGDKIEPKYYVPTIPFILLNGSDGVSTGFRQLIYPRNLSDIVAYIKKKISGIEKPRIDFLPWFKDYKGSTRINQDGQYEILGVIERKNTTNYIISEIPVTTQYSKYCDFLDKLVEDGTIVDYEDKCDPKTNDILFVVKTTRAFTSSHEDIESLYKVFHLVKPISENLNCIDENNRIREFSSIQEILDAFIEIRLSFYDKRKTHLLKTIRSELEILVSKYLFCKGIIEKTILVANKKKDEIIQQLEQIEKIIKVDESYDYLLRMPIHSVSKDKMIELHDQIKQKKEDYLKIKSTEIKDMWIDDLKIVEKCLNNKRI